MRKPSSWGMIPYGLSEEGVKTESFCKMLITKQYHMIVLLKGMVKKIEWSKTRQTEKLEPPCNV